MNKRTLTALEWSVLKWDSICAGCERDMGCDNCPLCVEFYDAYPDATKCPGCPVSELTGRELCEGTPYNGWSEAGFKFVLLSNVEDSEIGAELAEAELIFLLSLLPKGHPWRDQI